MKYLVRAVKYFIYLMVILSLIILVLIMTKMVESDISRMFVNGYDSLWQIALMMAAFALIYPRLGFSCRTAHLYGPIEDNRQEILRVMDILDYRLESEQDGKMCFVKRSILTRIMKMYEDRITISPTATGLEVEGLTKDIVRVVSGLEAKQEDV